MGTWFDAIFDTIRDVFDRVRQVFNNLIYFFKWITLFFKYLTLIVTCYLPSLYDYLKAHLDCGIDKIQSFMYCFIYYAIEIFGQVIYFPIRLIFYFSESTDIETSMWDSIEALDKEFYDGTGFHISHYSDEIQKKCYKCNIPILKDSPDWPSYDPPK